MAEDNPDFVVTHEVLEEMKKTLRFLEGEKREEIKEKIIKAREEGDLKENGGYHAAREQQSVNEGKIKELKYKIKNAVVKESNSTSLKKVTELTLVTINLEGTQMEFLVGQKELSLSTDHKTLSIETPLGVALLGKKKGEKVTYITPSGKKMHAEVVDIKQME